MLVVPFCVECRHKQHRAYGPSGVYLLVKSVEGCLFLAPCLCLALCTPFGFLRSIELCQGAYPQVVLRDTAITPDTAVIVRLRAVLFLCHCTTLSIVRQTSPWSSSDRYARRLPPLYAACPLAYAGLSRVPMQPAAAYALG
jgi:hypothetical protein